MRFVLDHDVDVACRRMLNDAGHDAWTVGEAGRALAKDDDQTVYAGEMGAVLITHDREFTTRRKRNAHGRHVRLVCPEPDGPDVLALHLDDVLPILERHENVTVEIKPRGFESFFAWE